MLCHTNRLPLRALRARGGFTLVEMMVAAAIGVLVTGVAVTLTVFTSRSFVALGNYADLDRSSRLAVDILTDDVRQAKALTSYTTNQLVFQDLTNGTFSYTWDPDARTLTRVYNGASRLLLTRCSSLTFHISQRTPSNDFGFWPANSVTNAKMIDVSWTCSRPILGQPVNTESVQTAKIAMRN
jgi:prepilin-type N-terminal cleavage/methylation domain-containing protein